MNGRRYDRSYPRRWPEHAQLIRGVRDLGPVRGREGLGWWRVWWRWW